MSIASPAHLVEVSPPQLVSRLNLSMENSKISGSNKLDLLLEMIENNIGITNQHSQILDSYRAYAFTIKKQLEEIGQSIDILKKVKEEVNNLEILCLKADSLGWIKNGLKKVIREDYKEVKEELDLNYEIESKINQQVDKIEAVLDKVIMLKAKKKLTPELSAQINDELFSSIESCNKDIDILVKIKEAQKIASDEIKAQSVDLAFLIDGTGSMQKYIDAVKLSIRSIIIKSKQKFMNSQINVGIVIYRDFDMEDQSIEKLDFTQNQRQIDNFLENIQAGGGGDAPEDINGGLQKLLELKWKNKSKIIVHFGDAPCHGKRFCPEDYASYPEHLELSKKNDQPWDVMFRMIKTMGIDYHFMKIHKSTTLMINEFKKIWTECGHYAFQKKKPIEFHVYKFPNFSNCQNKKEEIDKIGDEVVKNVSEFIIKTITSVSASQSKSKAYQSLKFSSKPLEIIHETPQNDTIPLNWDLPDSEWIKITGFVDSLKAHVDYQNFENDKDDELYTKSKITIKIQKKPFAKGSFNYAFAAKIDGFEQKIVAKRPIKFEAMNNDELEKYMYEEAEKRDLAWILAKNFNYEIDKLGDQFAWAKLYFIKQYLFYTELEKDESYIECKDWYHLEPLMEGNFDKFTNNLDYITSEIDVRNLTAFAHYTYQFTGNNYLVTDFQGVSSYLLTDPAIHSKLNKYTDGGDLSTKGMMYFFAKHNCNEICKKLNLVRSSIPEKELNSIKKWNEKIEKHDDEDFESREYNLTMLEYIQDYFEGQDEDLEVASDHSDHDSQYSKDLSKRNETDEDNTDDEDNEEDTNRY